MNSFLLVIFFHAFVCIHLVTPMNANMSIFDWSGGRYHPTHGHHNIFLIPQMHFIKTLYDSNTLSHLFNGNTIMMSIPSVQFASHHHYCSSMLYQTQECQVGLQELKFVAKLYFMSSRKLVESERLNIRMYVSRSYIL